MSDERWRRVENLYHESLQIPDEKRKAWLTSACAGDADLQLEVEALLRYEPAAVGFLEGTALGAAAAALARDRDSGFEGRTLGDYEVLAFLGAGGMGEVYRARDVRLRREVALKVFENTVSADAVCRFETEAQSASVLNHPNIVTIFGAGLVGETAFIAMELVPGRTLRERLLEGPLPFSMALDIAIQLADAMAAAHASGIVHRDLKPENVMLSPDGRVKVLDFGIATLQHELWSTTGAETIGAMLLGTPGYMAPEQEDGREIVPASDQFSFGLILREMLTGDRPVRTAPREAEQDSGATPLSRSDRTPEPVALAQVMARCLAVDPEQRYPDSADLLAALRKIRDLSNRPDAAGLSRRQTLTLAAMAAAGVLSGVAVWEAWPRGPGRSIVVLPFGNPAGDANTEYLCDGITETLIRQLASVPAITVIARGTAFTFKGTSADPRIIGQRLGVATILTGAVTRRGGRALISVELIESSSGARLWGTDFDRPVADVLAVQNEIAHAIITEGVQVRLSGAQAKRLSDTFTDDPVAYESFLLGVHHLRLATEEDYLAARESLSRAVARAPGFALGFVTLASTYSAMALDGYEPPSSAWPLSERNVTRAFEIDGESPDAHAEAASSAFFYRWNRAQAEHHWAAALGSPRGAVQSELLLARALQQWASGHSDTALELARAARQVDPLNPMAALREADLLAALGRVDAAERIYDDVIRDAPGDPRAHFGVAEVRRKQGRFAEAIAARRAAHHLLADVSLDPLFDRSSGAEGYEEIVRATALRQLERLEEREGVGGYVSPLDYGRLFAQLGQPLEAFKYLAAAFEERAPGVVLLRVDPAWDNVRDDPAFAAAIERVGLA